MVDKKFDSDVAQFCTVTGASVKDAKKFLEAHTRLDVAIDAYYTNPNAFASTVRRKGDSTPSTSKLGQLFEKYKDPDDGDITVDGTIKFCEDLEVDPEDVVLLALAYELKSKQIGKWTRQGWIDGWKSIGADSIQSMKSALTRLRNQLGSDLSYFQKVYNHTFDFARSEGQRSLGVEFAQALWSLLLPHGFLGGALAHVPLRDSDNDSNMDGREGFKEEYIEWWFEFLAQKGYKGVSKDTWVMFLDFIQSIDAEFSTYDTDDAWPSTIDDFVDYAKKRIGGRAS